MYRLLIVDDEEIITDGLYEHFVKIVPDKLEVFKAYSGEEALSWLKRYRFDILISDITMPGMDGFALIEHVHRSSPGCKVILLTGYSEFDYVYKAIQMSNVRYLLKTEGYPKVTQTLCELMEQIDSPLAGQRHNLRSMVPDHRGDKSSTVIEQICQYIESHLDEDLSLARLADIYYFNPSYLSRLFKQEYGMKLSEYIDQCRIHQAIMLLRDGDRMVREVALSVGYEAPNSFTRFFKKVTGLTPQEYRDAMLMPPPQ